MKSLLVDGGRQLQFFFQPAKTRLSSHQNPYLGGRGHTTRTLRTAWEIEQAKSITTTRSIQLQCQKVSSTTTGEQCFDFEIPLKYLNGGQTWKAVEPDMVTVLKSMSMPFSSTNGTSDARMVRFSVDQCFDHIKLTMMDVVSCAYTPPPPPPPSKPYMRFTPPGYATTMVGGVTMYYGPTTVEQAKQQGQDPTTTPYYGWTEEKPQAFFEYEKLVEQANQRHEEKLKEYERKNKEAKVTEVKIYEIEGGTSSLCKHSKVVNVSQMVVCNALTVLKEVS
jgi:hypothetical protein